MTGAIPALVRKDARALFPLWAAAAVVMAADPLLVDSGVYALFPIGAFAYIVGSLSLGAHVIGHEYSHRTLGTLLAQPIRRSSILLVKAGVLAAMVFGLSLLAWPLLAAPGVPSHEHIARYPTIPLTIAGSLLVAPWLTMQLRSQLAAIIFTASMPGVVYSGFLLAGIIAYGAGSDAAETLATRFWMPVVLATAAAGGVLGVRALMRLQDAEATREDLRLPPWAAMLDRHPVRPPLWMLVKKELRLQQLTFAMPVVFGAIWGVMIVAARIHPGFDKDFPIRGVGLLYFALLPLLIGSLASAQERHLGMAQSQAMLPVPFAQQWAVKAGVVLLLAFVLGVQLPWFVFAPPQAAGNFWQVALAILLMAAWSLYLSSWSPSGVIALALVLPATAAAIVSARWIDAFLGSFERGGAAVTPPSFMAMAAVLGLMLVLFAGRNHRALDRRTPRLASQAAWLLVVFSAADLLARAIR